VYLAQTLWKLYRWIALYLGLRRIYKRVKRDPQRHNYTDAALSPVADDEVETLELFRSEAARGYVEQERRLERIREGTTA